MVTQQTDPIAAADEALQKTCANWLPFLAAMPPDMRAAIFRTFRANFDQLERDAEALAGRKN